MLVGSILISALVGIAATLTLLSLGVGWLWALVLGYMGCGALAMGLASVWVAWGHRPDNACIEEDRTGPRHRDAGMSDGRP